MSRSPMLRPVVLLALSLSLVSACASSKKDAKSGADAKGSNAPAEAQVDRSRCDPKGKKVVEIDVSKDGKADVWKFYATSLENGAKVDALTCKEVDLNFDGKKDIWVYYDNAGNITNEEFDLDFDGKLDLWSYRQLGKIVRQELDTNFDGKTDIWRFFENDKLARVEVSSKKDGRIDMWEYYEGGKLDRIGYDSTGSGQVDRWDRAPEDPAAGARPTVAPEAGPASESPAAPSPPPAS